MQAKPYRFVGVHCIIHDHAELKRFGEPVMLTDEQADTVIRGGGAVLPEPDFDSLGFTAKELAAYPFPGQQVNAPEEFHAKKRAAQALFCRLHEEAVAAFEAAAKAEGEPQPETEVN